MVEDYQLSRDHFETLLDGLENDIRTKRIANYEQLVAYCEAVASPLAYLSLQILGVHGTAEERYARDVGIALQLGNILRDIAIDAARDHIYLPRDQLERAGVDDRDIIAGRMSPALAGVCRNLAEQAELLIVGARRQLPARARRQLLVPEIWADVYLDLLVSLARVDFDVFAQPPYQQRRRKLALALRRWSRELAPEWATRYFSEPPSLSA